MNHIKFLAHYTIFFHEQKKVWYFWKKYDPLVKKVWYKAEKYEKSPESMISSSKYDMWQVCIHG